MYSLIYLKHKLTLILVNILKKKGKTNKEINDILNHIDEVALTRSRKFESLLGVKK